MSQSLLDALEARSGIVCAVGAGGKKTTLYALFGAHPGRVGITTTVMMTTFSRRLHAHRLITATGDMTAAVGEAAGANARIAFAHSAHKSSRVAGIDAASVAPCHGAGRFDATYVKADGARMRSIKAPAAGEPIVPAETAVVVPLVSAAAFGAPLDDAIAHRPERVAAVTGLHPGEPISPEAVGHLLAAEEGALKSAPAGARVIPVINAVDDDPRRREAERAAAVALGRSRRLDRVVLTSHAREEPLLARIE
jgi:probable selenium-dependent hydroxylase accessory protein YqeC